MSPFSFVVCEDTNNPIQNLTSAHSQNINNTSHSTTNIGFVEKNHTSCVKNNKWNTNEDDTNNVLHVSTSSRTSLYAFGLNDGGQLVYTCFFPNQKGLNGYYYISTPINVEFFNDKETIQDIQTGSDYTIVLLKNGLIYGMGNIKHCKDASNDLFCSPVVIFFNNPHKVISICCSQISTMVQLENGKWYTAHEKKVDCEPNLIKDEKEVNLILESIDDPFSTIHSLSNIDKFETLTMESSKHIQVKKLVATSTCFFLLNNKNELYVVGNGGKGEMGTNNGASIYKWTLCKTNVLDVQTGLRNSFIFIPNPFLFYESQMEYTDIIIWV